MVQRESQHQPSHSGTAEGLIAIKPVDGIEIHSSRFCGHASIDRNTDLAGDPQDRHAALVGLLLAAGAEECIGSYPCQAVISDHRLVIEVAVQSLLGLSQ